MMFRCNSSFATQFKENGHGSALPDQEMSDLEKNLIGTASNTGRHRSAERMALGAIAACFILSRVLAWFLGVRFASSEVEYLWQFLDTGLLRAPTVDKRSISAQSTAFDELDLWNTDRACSTKSACGLVTS